MNDAMNLSSLSPIDFESLAVDLLSVVHGVRFERFGEGRDGGIDGQFQYIAEDATEYWIVQAKRYADVNRLISQMQAEHEKMQQLPIPPQRYFLVTSCSLLPAHKERIMATMSPYVCSTGDIYGAEDIRSILDSERALYARHHHLWLHSIEQLNQQLYAASFVRSKVALQLAFESAEHFIEQPQIAAIQQCLDERHACLVVGDPGSGKTTSASEVALRYFIAEPGLEVHWFSDRSFDEALNLVREGARQLFVMDDCFGATFLTDENAIKQHQSLSALMRLAETSVGHLRLVFTTRDYILQQALRQMGPSSTSLAALVQNAVRMGANNAQFRIDFTLHTLARTGLTNSVLQRLVGEELYWPIITDPRFSPRMMKLLCNQLLSVASDQLKVFIQNSLANPDNLWRDAYDRLSPEAQILTLLVGISRDYCLSSELLEGFLSLYKRVHGRFATTRQFEHALLEAEPVFIKSRAVQESIWLSVTNPGVHDFIYKELNANKPLLDSVIACLPVFNWGLESFAIKENSPKPIHLQPAQTEALLNKLVELLPEPSTRLVQNAETGQWVERTEGLGHQLTLLWQEVLHDKALAQWLFTKLEPLLPVGKDWHALVLESNMAALLNLSRVADCTMQVAIWQAAIASPQNSEDAAALAELYAEHQPTRLVFGKKKPFVQKLLRACLNEINTARDSYHLGAILNDLYRIEKALNVDISEPKHRITQALDPYESIWDDCSESDLEPTYYAEPELFEKYAQILHELEQQRGHVVRRMAELVLNPYHNKSLH